MLDPAVETRPWDEQLALDDAAYREQLGYLLERSAFYRQKLGAVGVEEAGDAGGIADLARLPLTEKQELRATATPDRPFGTHLCARPAFSLISPRNRRTPSASSLPLPRRTP